MGTIWIESAFIFEMTLGGMPISSISLGTSVEGQAHFGMTLSSLLMSNMLGSVPERATKDLEKWRPSPVIFPVLGDLRRSVNQQRSGYDPGLVGTTTGKMPQVTHT